MSRAAFGSLILAALALALVFRLPALDRRPMHHDEANQAVKLGELLETGDYRYDPSDHHGPTLYYLGWASARLSDRPTLASLDERTLRLVPVVFGAGLILLCAAASRGLGRPAVTAAAALFALSPAFTFYSRFFIQESIFVFLSLGLLLAAGRYAMRPGPEAAAAAGLCAGLLYATKETSVIVLAAVVVAAVVAWRTTRHARPPAPSFRPVAHGALALGVALAVAAAFFTAFFQHPAGLIDSVRAFVTYVDRGAGATVHVQDWSYYLRLLLWSSSGGLVWTEAGVLLLAAAGLVAAVRSEPGAFWPRYVALYAVIATGVYSAIPYKTPWNLLPFYAGLVLMAGTGLTAIAGLARSRAGTAAIVACAALGAVHMGDQNYLANGPYAADERNPWVYAHTSNDYLRLVERVRGVRAAHADGTRMRVDVLAGPHEQWPTPWYLRDMPHVGYWARADEAGAIDGVPVIIASQDSAPAVDAAVGDRYVSEFYALRPEVFLSLYVERGLWERYLAGRQ